MENLAKRCLDTRPKGSHGRTPVPLERGVLVSKIDKGCELAIELDLELSIVGHEPDLLDQVPDAFGSFQAGIRVIEGFGKIDELVTI
jgi:hypothetical protein